MSGGLLGAEAGPDLAGRSPLDAVLFDIDDTLVDSRAGFAAGIDAVCRRFLPHLPADRYGEALALWRADSEGYYRRYTRGELGFEAQRMARANQIQSVLGGPLLDGAAYEEWAELFWGEFERSWVAFDDAAGAVNTLLGAGLRVGSVTNAANEMQTRKLAATGFGATVPMLVGVDTLGVGKPDPRVWLEACRMLDVDPARTAYIGDELDIDAGGAQAAGLVGVWLDRPGRRRGGPHPEDPELARQQGIIVVGGLDELAGALGVRAVAPTA